MSSVGGDGPPADWYALSPLDGRYRLQTGALADCWSEWALMRERVAVEAEWLIALGDEPAIEEVPPLSAAQKEQLRRLGSREGFGERAMSRIKELERVTRHDVKAVEYYVREALAGTSLEHLGGFVHVAFTSEDVNNVAHARMLRDALQQVWLPAARSLIDDVAAIARAEAETPMLSRTHGQAATPTTLGKEMAVFVHRFRRQVARVAAVELLAKSNGAVGTFGAHAVAWPQVDWIALSRRFIEDMGLTWNPLTTQIENHDAMAELFHAVIGFNSVLLGFDQDLWSYVSLGYFRQRVVAGEVGSSTMPHKVNPINFENSEANVGVSSALLGHLAQKLTVSRLQRDLSDSSALRTVGTALGHSVVAIDSARAGVARLAVDHAALAADLDDAWEVLAEALQTVLRKHRHADPYERLKELTQGRKIDESALRSFVAGLGLPEAEMASLSALRPRDYTGRAAELVRLVLDARELRA